MSEGTETVSFQGLSLDLTEKCNIDCQYCYFGKKGSRTMELDTAMQVLRNLQPEIARWGGLNLAFMGAEPLMAFDRLKEIVLAYEEELAARGFNFRWHTVSNMGLLNSEMVDFFRVHGGFVHCSHDGTPEAHALNRTGQVIDLSKQLEHVREITDDRSVRMTVTPQTVSMLFAGIVQLMQHGFHGVAAYPAFSLDNPWRPEQMKVLQQQVQQITEARVNGELSGLISINPFDGYLAMLAGQEVDMHCAHCGAGRRLLAADIDGELWPCHRFTRQQFPDFLIGPTYSEERIKLLSREYPEQCSACELQGVCRGGCWAENLVMTGDLDLPSAEHCQTNAAMNAGVQMVGASRGQRWWEENNDFHIDRNGCVICDSCDWGCHNCDRCDNCAHRIL